MSKAWNEGCVKSTRTKSAVPRHMWCRESRFYKYAAPVIFICKWPSRATFEVMNIHRQLRIRFTLLNSSRRVNDSMIQLKLDHRLVGSFRKIRFAQNVKFCVIQETPWEFSLHWGRFSINVRFLFINLGLYGSNVVFCFYFLATIHKQPHVISSYEWGNMILSAHFMMDDLVALDDFK